MPTGVRRSVLPYAYVIPVTAFWVLLAIVGYVVDRLPILPTAVHRGYQRVMFAAIFGLSRVVDGWIDQPAEPVAGGLTGESAP